MTFLKQKTKNDENGFGHLLLILIVAVAVLGVVGYVAVNKYSDYKTKKLDLQTTSTPIPVTNSKSPVKTQTSTPTPMPITSVTPVTTPTFIPSLTPTPIPAATQVPVELPLRAIFYKPLTHTTSSHAILNFVNDSNESITITSVNITISKGYDVNLTGLLQVTGDFSSGVPLPEAFPSGTNSHTFDIEVRNNVPAHGVLPTYVDISQIKICESTTDPNYCSTASASNITWITYKINSIKSLNNNVKFMPDSVTSTYKPQPTPTPTPTPAPCYGACA